MIRTTLDPEWFNKVANTPGIKEWVDAGLFFVNVESLFKQGGLGVCTTHGGFILVQKGPGRYAVHAFFPKQPDRFRHAVNDSFEFLKWFFLDFTAVALEAETPIASDMRGTGELLRTVGFEREREKDGVVYYRLNRRRFLDRYGVMT